MNANERLEQLNQQLAALPDPLDVPPRQYIDVETKRSRLLAQIQTIGMAQATLADVDPKVAELEKWRDHLVSWRKALCDELLACPRTEAGRLRCLELSVIRIDRGLDFMNEAYPARLPVDDLMAAAGYVPHDAVARAHGDAWLGPMPSVEQRLRELHARQADARTRLHAALGDGEVSPQRRTSVPVRG
jgi:hypothetical protein